MKSMISAVVGLAVAAVPIASANASDADTFRLAGANRYETAVAVSQDSFTADAADPAKGLTDLVFVASGAVFADGLAAGPAAASFGGSLLLVPATGPLPAKTAAEINRLRATEVVVVGGPGSVSKAMEAQLAALPTVTNVVREDGPNRYATAALIAQEFEMKGGALYLASGEDYPDALAAGAVAGGKDVPLLLTKKSVLPAETAAAIKRQAPTSVVVAGGVGSVADSVLASVKAAAPSASVVRVAGANRFETAARLSASAIPSKKYAYIASGESFADALAGGAAAGLFRGPLLLTKKDCVPQPTLAELKRVGATEFLLLGGPGVASKKVVDRVPC